MQRDPSEVPAPWSRYPMESPHSGMWRQGDAEAWMTYVWRPYFETLGDEGKAAYLDRWNAPPDWREFLSESFWDELARIDEEDGF